MTLNFNTFIQLFKNFFISKIIYEKRKANKAENVVHGMYTYSLNPTS